MIIFLAGLIFLSFILTFLIKTYALKYKVLDIPNARSSHTSPTPRGGGLAIVICWYIGLIYLYIINMIDRYLFLALLSGALLALISLIDDIFSIKPVIRLSVQFITSVIAVYFLKGLQFVDISGWIIDSDILLIPLIVLAVVWFVNVYNFIDGIDGYASLEAVTIGTILYLLTGNIICLLLVACVAGFLFWNWPRAKIFMGDIGSTQLGFILIVLGIYFQNLSELNFIHWLMLTSLFWFDATLTLFRRFRKGEKLSVAHRKHAYQRIVIAGFSHQKAILFSLAINIFISFLVVISKNNTWLLIPAFFLNLFSLYLLTRMIDKKAPFC